MTVTDQVHKPLGLRVGGARLPIDEAEEPLAGGPQKVVAAIVRRFVQRGHVGRTLQHSGQGLTRVCAEVENRLAGVEALDKRSEEHTSELQSRGQLVCRLLLEKKNSTRSSASDRSRRCCATPTSP